MPRLLQLGGIVAVTVFMFLESGPINAWLASWGLPFIHPAVLPAVLGLLLYGVLLQLRILDSLTGVLSLLIALAVGWFAWEPVNLWALSTGLPALHPVVAPLLLGLLVMALIQALTPSASPVLKLRGKGLATFPAWRRATAIITNAVLTVATLLVGLGMADWVNGVVPAEDHALHPSRFLGNVFDALGRVWHGGPAALPTIDYAGTVLVLLLTWLVALDTVKSGLGWVTLPVRRLWTALQTGLGGSARFLSYPDEWSMHWRPGRLLIGTSVYDGKKLGRKDDRHAIVVATTRSGKGRSFIIPNLLTYPGSAFIIDPKGENAAVTARIRKRKLGQTVHILDPFGMVDRMKLSRFWRRGMARDGQPYRAARYNPMADIDLTSFDAVEQIQNLGAALVTVHPGANPFWDNASQIILAGVIAHILVTDQLTDADRHLGTVRDYVAGINGRDLAELDLPVPPGRPVLGNLAAAAASQLREASKTAGSDIMVTLRVHMRWLNSEAIRASLSGSDVSLRDLKYSKTSIYLVIPPEYLETHSCYLRVMATMGLREAGKGAKPDFPMLYMLDEFAAMGKLAVMAQAAAVATGSGLLLCPVVQDITQLRIYGQSWEVFLSNAGQHQVFAANDLSTAEYFTNRLGGHMTWRHSQGEWSPNGVNYLRTSGELMRETSRASGQALVSFEGSEAMLVRRANYDTWFGTYDPNPYERNSLKARTRRLVLEWGDVVAPDQIWGLVRKMIGEIKRISSTRSAY